MKTSKADIYEMIASLLNVDVEYVKNINEDEDLMLHGMTSISCIKLVVMLEEKYNFDLKDEDLLIEKYNTFNKLFALLDNY
ncbi:acyl carrier protein [Bacillus sp. FJAT-27264]|uniref:acyl carrier protein n=1 Tax=Paenibacillus sp. (strain DSM 101736 / FJAT-27264) TaxID=1850362 RepID=UPI0009F39CA7|nr:acyl carrier protein [Bacillus sp. FJAT-27264]